jgi:hypothetical protein
MAAQFLLTEAAMVVMEEVATLAIRAEIIPQAAAQLAVLAALVGLAVMAATAAAAVYLMKVQDALLCIMEQ